MISMSFQFFVVLGVVTVISAFCAGYRFGRENERDRVLGLMYEPFRRGRMSGTLRWVLRSVASGDRVLPSDTSENPGGTQ